MSVLPNYRRERFCQLVFSGTKPDQAVKDAGFSEKLAYKSAYYLMKHPQIIARLDELFEAAASDKVLNRREKMEKLSDIARGKLTDFIAIEGDELTIDLTADNPSALQEVSVESWRGGKDQRAQSRTSKVKLRDPIAAIQELNKMAGDYAPQKHAIAGVVKVIVEYEGDTPELEEGQEDA